MDDCFVFANIIGYNFKKIVNTLNWIFFFFFFLYNSDVINWTQKEHNTKFDIEF